MGTVNIVVDNQCMCLTFDIIEVIQTRFRYSTRTTDQSELKKLNGDRFTDNFYFAKRFNVFDSKRTIWVPDAHVNQEISAE